jgi:membrane protein
MNHIPFKEIVPLSRVAVRNWQNDRAPRMGAALAYYIALSLAPTVLILLAIAGFAFGAQAAQGRLVSQIQGFVGYEGAQAIQTMIEGARRPSRGIAATVLGLVTVFFAASAVVSELRDAMNTIWRVPEDTTSSTVRSIFNLVKERLVSFALVLASGLFLVVSLIVNAWIFAAGKYLNSGAAPPEALVQTTDWVVSFVVITVLCAFIFKVLPRVPLEWGDVAIGAVLTSLLFAAVRCWKVPIGLVSRQIELYGYLRSGRLARDRTGMGILFGAGAFSGRRIHASLRLPLRLNARA